MIEKGTNQKLIKIRPITLRNDDSISAQLDNTGNGLVELHPKHPLHSVV